METRDVNGFEVSFNDGYYCLTDYYEAISYKGHAGAIFTSRSALKHIENVYSIKIDPKKVYTAFKRNKIYKTTGARHTKKTWAKCDLFFFIVGYIEKQAIVPNYIRDESLFYDMLQKFFHDIIIIPQKYINGYFIDFYIEKYNLAIEFDELKHKQWLDELRENDIQKTLKCHFIRVKIGEEIEGLRAIYDFIKNK